MCAVSSGESKSSFAHSFPAVPPTSISFNSTPLPAPSVFCWMWEIYFLGRGAFYNQCRLPPKVLSLPTLAHESQSSQYLQSSKSSSVECCSCCGGECLALSRHPAGSEGELARGGEQKNVCIIKIRKMLIFMTFAGNSTPMGWEKSLQQNGFLWHYLVVVLLTVFLTVLFYLGML